MKRLLGLLFYVAVLGVMLYAASQLYQPSTLVHAIGDCCNKNQDCGSIDKCVSATQLCTLQGYSGSCTIQTSPTTHR